MRSYELALASNFPRFHIPAGLPNSKAAVPFVSGHTVWICLEYIAVDRLPREIPCQEMEWDDT